MNAYTHDRDYTSSEVEKKRTYVTKDLLGRSKELYRERGISYTLWWYLKEVW